MKVQYTTPIAAPRFAQVKVAGIHFVAKLGATSTPDFAPLSRDPTNDLQWYAPELTPRLGSGAHYER